MSGPAEGPGGEGWVSRDRMAILEADLLDGLAGWLGDLLAKTGPAAPVVLFLASMVEYVFPPFPGDLLVVLGASYAVEGHLSWALAFAATSAGAMAGAAIDYGAGRWLAPRLDARATRRGPLSAARLARFVKVYRRYGPLFLVVNRFLPGLRGVVFLSAGAAKLPVGQVLLLGGISVALWNGLLLWAGALLARNLADLVEMFREYSQLALAVLLVGAVVVGAAPLFGRLLRAGGRGKR